MGETREAKKNMGGSTPRVAARSALKGAAVQAKGGHDRGLAGLPGAADAVQSGDNVIAIRTKAGTVRCSPNEIVCTRIGLRFDCCRIVLEYVVPDRGLRGIHRVDVDFASYPDLRGDSNGEGAQSGCPSPADIAV